MTVCYWCGAKDTLADIGKELDDGKYKMVQCSKCKNAYYVVNREKMNKPKPQTNEEYLRSLNTEQLAKWIQYVICHCKHCNADNAFLCQFYDKVGFVPCVGDGLVEWLKQPHQ